MLAVSLSFGFFNEFYAPRCQLVSFQFFICVRFFYQQFKDFYLSRYIFVEYTSPIKSAKYFCLTILPLKGVKIHDQDLILLIATSVKFDNCKCHN